MNIMSYQLCYGQDYLVKCLNGGEHLRQWPLLEMIMVHTMKDNINNICQEVPHVGQGGVRGYQLLHHVKHLCFTPGKDVHL